MAIQKIILDLCGGSGAWSKPYSNAGYDVRLITLPEQNVTDYIPPANVYGILAAPPCTMFSIARNRYDNDPRCKPRDFIEGMNIVNACMRIIFQCQNTLHFWALENPVGLLTRWLGKYQYRFEPWWFEGAENWTKRTGIWGEFNIPQRKYFDYNERPDAYKAEYICCVKRYILRKTGIPSIADITHGGESERRAVTSGGFAKAFFEANQ